MFFYYWVPTPVHIGNGTFSPTFQSDKKLRTVISDLNDRTEILLEINDTTFDFQLIVLSDQRPLETQTAKLIDSNDVGFLVYEVENELSRETEQILKIQAYHLFKKFFHNHEFHEDNHDSILEAYVSDISTDHEKASGDYCKQYAEKFETYKANWDLHTPDEIINDFTQNSIIGMSIESIATVKKDIQDALGEMIYADFLLQYAHEKNFTNVYRIYNAQFNRFKKDFEIIHKRYELAYEKINLAYSENINRLQVILGGAGVFLGLVGAILGIIGVKLSWK